MFTVKLTDFVEKFKLIDITPEIDYSSVLLTLPDINRPALQLAGYFDYFDAERPQVIGKVEHTFFSKVDLDLRDAILEKLFSFPIPCIIVCRNMEVFPEMIRHAVKSNVPILLTDENTSDFMSEAIRWLKVEFAPRTTIHGVFVDVYGEGVLILGESGVGKSEMALELIKRGHRLVADDAVEIRRVSSQTLVGTSPEMIRHFIELRGIGVINVKQMFGVGSIKMTQNVDLVIKLEVWDKQREYDRLGLHEAFVEILSNKIICYEIPIRPGRNLAVICEAAAINHRQKRMGYNAAQVLSDRVMNVVNKSSENAGEDE